MRASSPRSDARWAAVVAATALLVAGAILAEVLAAANANSSPLPSFAPAFPLAWPQAGRVAWWLGIAGAAGLFRLGLHRLGFPQRRVIVVVSVLPFAAMAAGVAAGAEWATWH